MRDESKYEADKMERILSQNLIDLPPLAAPNTSYLCLINVFSYFGLLHSSAGCMQGEAWRGTSIHSGVSTSPLPDVLFPSAGQQGQAQKHSVVKFHFTLCVSIDFY